MGRKPQPKIKMNNEEYNLVNSILKKTKMDCWCSIDGYRSDYDMMYDSNYGKNITLAYGIKVINSGLYNGWEVDNLSTDEQKTWGELKKKLNVRD